MVRRQDDGVGRGLAGDVGVDLSVGVGDGGQGDSSGVRTRLAWR